MWTTGFPHRDMASERSRNGAVLAILAGEDCSSILTTTLVDGLTFCGAESLGSRGLARWGTLIAWKTKKIAAAMPNGSRHFLWVK